MAQDGAVLDGFHPLVREWFSARFPAPTPVQAGVWAALSRGEHVLAEAPTGNGKTFAAFLHALSSLAAGELPSDRLSILYISPLKALNEDIRRNLEEPLAGIEALAKARDLILPRLAVETRSGDTPEAARRRFLKRPPSILCTTPESFAILLDSPRARPILAEVRLVIVDEIHALAGSKRGALLACCLGRLVLLAGEYRRVALSATLRPAEAIAAWFGALRMEGKPGAKVAYVTRPVTLVAPSVKKEVEFCVEWPAAATGAGFGDGASVGGGAKEGLKEAPGENTRYGPLVRAFIERVGRNRTSLIFCDARRRAERISYLMNQEGGEGLSFAHHGSLSREVRDLIEGRLKEGALRCVVATSTLELGIDVGTVDEVILAGAPPSIASAIQRAGRSGHGVGRVSKVSIFPFHGLELLQAGAIVREAKSGVMEALEPPRNPLDILAQTLLSLAAEEPRSVEALHDIVRSFAPFEGLPRELFDSTLELLAGRWSDSRLRELEARVHIDKASDLVTAVKGARRLLHSSGGTIPDRGLYSLRLEGEGRRIGELDEEFVWERRIGDSFSLGSQAWRIVDIGAEAVSVVPLDRAADFIPFWKGGPNYESPELARGLLDLVDRLSTSSPAARRSLLAGDCGFGEEAIGEVERFLAAQKEAQGRAPLPARNRLALELVRGGASRGGTALLIVHTIRGGRVNEALALVLAAALDRDGHLTVQVQADDEGVFLFLPGGEEAEATLAAVDTILRGLGDRREVETLLRSRIEGSGLFAAAFRENAGRALLLPRGLPGKRTPLWITRLRASRLFEAVRSKGDFPITLETWRSLLVDYLDLDSLAELLGGLATGRIALAAFRSASPSPFASGARWAETNELLYRGDDLGASRSSVSARAIEEALDSARRRPSLDPELALDFARRKKRLVRGWAPEDLSELAEWVKERVAVDAGELDELVAIGGMTEAWEADRGAGGRLARLRLPGATLDLVVHEERREALLRDPAAHLAEWLRFEGPVERTRLSALFGLSPEALEDLVEGLVVEGLLLGDVLLRGSEEALVIDRDNCEILLRLGRKAARPRVEARPAADLFRFIALVQGLGSEEAGPERETEVMEGLAGYPAPASLWETAILPPRLGRGAGACLDRLLGSGEWLWFGCGRETIAFANAWNYELFAPPRLEPSALVPAHAGALDFWKIREVSGLGSRDCALALWAEAWEGRVTADGFGAIRKGLANRFGKDLAEAADEAPSDGNRAGARRIPLALRQRWKRGAPVEGDWTSLELDGDERDPLDEEELDRERVRLLVKRYGILQRPLLERELGALSWRRLFPCLRRMELAGELLFGYFFRGVPAPQFMGPEFLPLFMGMSEGATTPLWLSALDPASPAGFPFDETPALSIPRSLSNSLCLSGGGIVAATRRSGKDLLVSPELGEGELRQLLAALAANFGRGRIETIDGAPAASSPHAALLIEAGFDSDRGILLR